MQATADMLLCPSILKLVGTYARRVHRRYPKTMDYEDAQQELMEHLIKHIDKYDPKRGTLLTFASAVVRNRVSRILRKSYSDLSKYEDCIFIDEDDCIESLYDWEGRALLRIGFDYVEKDLRDMPELPKIVFKMMRSGMRTSDCADALECGQPYISQQVTLYLRNLVKKRCS